MRQTKFHHSTFSLFEFHGAYKDKVHCKMDIDLNNIVHHIFSKASGSTGFPDAVTPTGMTKIKQANTL